MDRNLNDNQQMNKEIKDKVLKFISKMLNISALTTKKTSRIEAKKMQDKVLKETLDTYEIFLAVVDELERRSKCEIKNEKLIMLQLQEPESERIKLISKITSESTIVLNSWGLNNNEFRRIVTENIPVEISKKIIFAHIMVLEIAKIIEREKNGQDSDSR